MRAGNGEAGVAPADVRRLSAGDLALQREVLALYAEVFDDPAGYASAPPGDDYLRELLGRRDFIQLAAVAEGRAVGALSGYVLQKFEQERAEIYIYDLAMLEPWRRQGIATALIAALGPIAQEVGAWVVYVQADLGGDPRSRSTRAWVRAKRCCISIWRWGSGGS